MSSVLSSNFALSLAQTVVAVNLTSASIDVDENNPNSSVCIALDGALGRNVNATVEIGPKAGASDPATGDTHTHSYMTLIGIHEMHGQMYPN